MWGWTICKYGLINNPSTHTYAVLREWKKMRLRVER